MRRVYAVADAELDMLAEEIAALPHAPACPRGLGCWCPIHDVLDLIQDRRDTLASTDTRW